MMAVELNYQFQKLGATKWGPVTRTMIQGQ